MPKGPTSRHIGGSRCGPVAAAGMRPCRRRCDASESRSKRHRCRTEARCLRHGSVLFLDICSAAHEMHSGRLSGPSPCYAGLYAPHGLTMALRWRYVHHADIAPLSEIRTTHSGAFATWCNRALSTIRIEIRRAMILRKLPRIAVLPACFMLSGTKRFRAIFPPSGKKSRHAFRISRRNRADACKNGRTV